MNAPAKSPQDLLLRMLGPPADERVDPAKVTQARGHLLGSGVLNAKGLTTGELAAIIAANTTTLLVLEHRHPTDEQGKLARIEFLEVFVEKLQGRAPLILVDDDLLLAEPRLSPGEIRLAGYRGAQKLRQDRVPPGQRLVCRACRRSCAGLRIIRHQ